MKREISSHKVNGLNEALQVVVLDEPGQGNACHEYQVQTPLKQPAEQFVEENSRLIRATCRIHFQNGPINEVGVNGISNEALLAVVRDRLEGFQAGEYASAANQDALDHVIIAMDFLKSRTKERMERGVEETHAV